jgi:hypothetical protein
MQIKRVSGRFESAPRRRPCCKDPANQSEFDKVRMGGEIQCLRFTISDILSFDKR